ncbi:MAG TPA: hypothetical protein VKA27_09890 [Sunxiuqinia sp.]|nr:hypothetical protein [Sunxiuqinia sp.]
MEENKMDNTRKKQLGIILAAVVIVIVAAVGSFYIYNQKQTEVKSLTAKNTDLNEMIENRDSVVNDLVNSFNEIEDNLKFIKEKRKQLSIEEQKEGGVDKKQSIINDIKLMNSMLEESSKHIAELEKKLKRSGIRLNAFQQKIASLSKTVADQNSDIEQLRKTVEEKNVMVAGLNQRVDSMQYEIAKRNDTIETKQQVIAHKTDELNTGHVAYGTYKELKDKGLLVKDGGFLGLGRSTELQENFDPEYFTDLNIQETKTIPIHSKKAMIITDHPDSSYTLVKQDGQIAYLQINNPNEFWKISKYAVIEVK